MKQCKNLWMNIWDPIKIWETFQQENGFHGIIHAGIPGAIREEMLERMLVRTPERISERSCG